MNQTRPHWYILGAGAMGCLWASFLTLSNQQVSLILKNTHDYQAINAKIGDRQHCIQPTAETADSLAAIQYLLVCTKAYDVLTALDSIQHRLTPDTHVVLTQNGMGLYPSIQQHYPELKLLYLSSNCGAHLKKPFEWQLAGTGRNYLGDPMQQINLQDIQDILSSLIATGLDIVWQDDITPRLWQKMAINCTINPLSSILQCRNGDLLKTSESIFLIKQLCQEIEKITDKLKIKFKQPLWQTVINVAKLTADNYSSMLQDVRQGRLTELAYLNAYIVKLGEQLKVSTPTHHWVLNLMNKYELRDNHNEKDYAKNLLCKKATG